VVLLSAPAETLLSRIDRRTTNPYGKTADERHRSFAISARLNRCSAQTCTHELDATRPVEDLVARLIEIGEGASS
jgi:hypothetical protein